MGHEEARIDDLLVLHSQSDAYHGTERLLAPSTTTAGVWDRVTDLTWADPDQVEAMGKALQQCAGWLRAARDRNDDWD